MTRSTHANGLGRPLLVDAATGHPASQTPAAFALPAGTVTFLLTDVEGSTRLWEASSEAMPTAIARHYEILDAAIVRHGGVRPVEQGEGDSVVAAFARAADALGAAVDAQRALVAEPWPAGARLGVRMALHTGDARLRDEGNYFGGAVNRCARLRGIAHGGQVLLSRATHDLVQDAVPPDVELVDLGVHRLRDLGRPERVFAAVHPEVPAVSEPLWSLDALPNNLPVELSSFVGRRRELTEVGDALASTRVLTLTGAGGCGKTRLALQAAADALDRHPDGVWWVELAPLADPGRLGDAVCAAIGVRPLPGQSPAEAAVAHLTGARALLVLDNCEHLLGASADLSDALLRNCPQVTLLITSREPLGLAGETSWRVPSLSLPADATPQPTDALTQSDAVRLFVERATQVRPNFAVTNENAPAVAQVCHDLDGIPLAIELAAARVRMLSPEQIASGLADRFRLLTGGARTALPRQQTLRASVDWSHDLLDPSERLLLRRLGVFAGGFDLDACEEVCAGDGLDRYAILDLLASLVDKSLVQAEERGPQVRYRLLETVRRYALDELTSAGEAGTLRDRHRDAFLALSERTEPDLLSEREPEALDRLDVDGANLYAALEWATETQPDLALRMCAALTLWWRLRGRFAAGGAALERGLGAASEAPSPARGRALWAHAYLAVSALDVDAVRRSAAAALAIAEELGDGALEARALHTLGFLDLFADPRAAVATCTRSRDLAAAAGDDFIFADATQVLGFAHYMQDDYAAAMREWDVAYAVAQRLGNRDIMAMHWVGHSITPLDTADLARRRELLERGRAFSDEVGDPQSEGFVEAYIALLEIHTGAPDAALERLSSCLNRMVVAGAGMPLGTIEGFMGIAYASSGRMEEAHAALSRVSERAADGYVFIEGYLASSFAAVERLRGDAETARAQAERGLDAASHVGSGILAAQAEHELARLAAARGDWGDAERLAQDSLAKLVAGDHGLHVPDALEALAEVAAGLESDAEAVRLLAAASRGRADIGIVRWWPEAAHWDALASRLRERLGDEAHDAAHAEGAALSLDEAVAYVRRARGSRKRPSGGWESLTPTEQEVARHAAAGLTNPEIGERMFVSRGTVKVHLSHIYAKLGVRNRAELTAEATRRDPSPTAPR